MKGFNDLFTTNPEIIEQWDFDKNKDINPYTLSKGSQRKAWWKCPKGHSYQQIIISKTDGVGCPICNGKKVLTGYNDLKFNNSKLADEWNYDRNNNLLPEMIATNSNKRVWWICDKGHEWEATISSRNYNNSGCPVCGNKKLLKGYNDLVTTNPSVLLDWNYQKNTIDPSDELPTDKKKICFWKCHICGYEYTKSIYNKVRSPRCPKCRNKK